MQVLLVDTHAESNPPAGLPVYSLRDFRSLSHYLAVGMKTGTTHMENC